MVPPLRFGPHTQAFWQSLPSFVPQLRKIPKSHPVSPQRFTAISKQISACSSAPESQDPSLASVQVQLQRQPILHSINEATAWSVVTTASATVLLRHDAIALWSVVGSLVSAIVCKVLKKVINEQRPPNARASDPGMPSSHATSLAFLATYAAVPLALRPDATAWHLAFSAAISLLAVFLTWLRVHTGYHTAAQTAAGSALGIFCSVTWLQLFQSFVQDWATESWTHFGILLAAASVCASLFIFKLLRKKKKSAVV